MAKPCNLKRSLLDAIIADDRKTVRELLKKDAELAGASILDEGYLSPEITHWIYAGDTALHVAAAAYAVEIAKLLLAAGANVNAADNHRQSQPLHYAADGYLPGQSWNPKRQVAMIELLLKSGADLHARDKNGATPLHRAVRTRCAAAVICLLDAGSDATTKNKPGSTPFHLAVQNTGRGGSGSEVAKAGQHLIISHFLRRGISPSLADENGKTVLQWAKSDWIREMLMEGDK